MKLKLNIIPLLLFALLAILVFIGCGKSSDGGDAAPPQNIIVKGLYVGMSTNELPQAIASKFGAEWECGPYGIYEAFYIRPKGLMWSGSQLDNFVNVWHDSAGIVQKVSFGKIISPRVFQAADTTAKDFARTFVEAYSIPELSPNGSWWEHTTPDNVRIRVGLDKSVVLERVASETESRSNFN